MSTYDPYKSNASHYFNVDENGEPLSFADSMRNLRNNDPNAARKLELQIASERNKKLLQGHIPRTKIDVERWRASGFDDATIDKHIRKQQMLDDMPIADRLANIERMKAGDPNAIDDWQFAQDLETKSTPQLVAEYGQEAANYSMQLLQQKMSSINEITRDRQKQDLLSWNTVGDMGLAVLRKGVDIVNSTINLGDLALNGDRAVERIARKDGFLDRVSEGLRHNMSTGYHNAEEVLAAKDGMRDQLEWENVLKYRQQGYLKEQAQSKANSERQWEQLGDMLDPTLFAPQAAELAADLVGGGLVAGAANVATRAAVNAVGRQIQKQALKNINKAVNARVKSKFEPRLKAKSSAEKNAEILDITRKEARAAADEFGAAVKGLKESDVIATGLGTGNKVYKGTLAHSLVAERAKRAANSLGKEIKAEKDLMLKVDLALVKERLGSNVTAKTLGSIGRDIERVGNAAVKINSLAAVTAYGSNQEAMEAIGSTYNQLMAISSDTLYRTPKGKAMIDSLVQEKGFSSYEEAKKDSAFMDELYKRQSKLAAETSISAYKQVFKDSALVNLLTSRAELAIGGVASKAKGFKNHLTDAALKTLGEGLEEFVEGYSGEYRPKDEINKAVGSQIYDPTKQAFATGVHGSLVAMAGTGGINALPLGKKAAGKAAAVVAGKIDSIGEKSANTNSDNEMKSIVTGVDVSPQESSSIVGNGINAAKNFFGVASKLSPEQQEELNAKYLETYTGKEELNLNKTVESINDPKVKEFFDKNPSLTARIQFFNDSFHKNSKEITQLESATELTEEQAKRLTELNDYNTAIKNTLQGFQTAVRKDIQNRRNEITENTDTVNSTIDIVNNQLEAGQITPKKAQEHIQKLQKTLKEENDKLTKEIQKLQSSTLYKAIFETELEQSPSDNNESTPTISPKDLERIYNSHLGSSSINIRATFEEGAAKIDANPNLTAKQKTREKRRLALGMIKAVRRISTNRDTTLDNVREHWETLGKEVEGIIASLTSKDFGLEPNLGNMIVALLSHIKYLSHATKDMSAKEALTLMGKYVGTKQGGFENQGNIGLLAYAQRALENKGKLSPVDELFLFHFYNTQEQKLLALKALEIEMLESGRLDDNDKVIGDPFNLINWSLKEDPFTKQQDRDNSVQFFSLGELRSYMEKVEKDQEYFSEFANKFFNLIFTPSYRVSGQNATRNRGDNPSKKPEQKSKTDATKGKSNKPKKDGYKNEDKDKDSSTGSKGKPSTDTNGENKNDSIVVVEPGLNENSNIVTGNENIVRPQGNTPTDDLNEGTEVADKEDPLFKAINEYNNYGSPSWNPTTVVPAKDVEVQEFVNEFRANVKLPKGFDFTEDQWRGLHFLNNSLNTKDNFTSVIAGYAGSGKSTMIDYLFQYRKAMGLPMSSPIYITPTHAAGVVISAKTRNIYATVKAVLKSLILSTTTGETTVTGSLKKAIDLNNANGANINSETEVFVVDEASMINSAEFEQLVAKIQNYNPNSHIIFMGDYMQLPPITESNDSLVTLSDGTKAQLVPKAFRQGNIFELKQIKRTNDNATLTVLDALRNAEEGKLGMLPVMRSAKGNLKFLFWDDREPTNIVEQFREAYNASPQSTLWIAYSNAEVSRLNKEYRERILGYSKDTVLQLGEWVIGHIGFGDKSTMKDHVANSISYQVKSIGKLEADTKGFKTVKAIFHQNPELAKLGIDTVPTAKFLPLGDMDNIKVTNDSAAMASNMENLRKYMLEGFNQFYQATKIPKKNKQARYSALNEAIKYMEGLRDYTFSASYDFLPVFDNGKIKDVQFKLRTGSSNVFYSTLYEKSNDTTIDPSVRELYKYILNGIPEQDLQDIFSVVKGIDYNFAITIHKSQGMSIDNVFYKAAKNRNSSSKLIVDTEHNVVTNELNSLHYTAMSRAAETLTVVIDEGVPYYELTGSTSVSTSPSIKTKEQAPKPKVQIVHSTGINKLAYEHIDFELLENEDILKINDYIYKVRSNRKAGSDPVITEEQADRLLQIAKNRPEIASLLYAAYNLNSKPVDLPAVTFEIHIDKDFNLNITKDFAFGYNGKNYSNIKEYLGDNNRTNKTLEENLKPAYFYWALSDEYVFNQIQNNSNPTLFIGKTATDEAIASVLNKMHEYFKGKSYDDVVKENKRFIDNFTSIKNHKGETPAISSDPIVNTPAMPKWVNIIRLTISQIVANWTSTMEFIISRYNPKYALTYRLTGLNVFQNPETGEVTVSNILSHPDIIFKENKYSLGIPQGASYDKEIIANIYNNYVTSDTPPKNKDEINEFINRYAELTDYIHSYLADMVYTKSKFNLNGILQLMTVTEQDGKIIHSYPSELPEAMTRAFIQALNRSHISKGSDVHKQYSQDGQYQLMIEDLSYTSGEYEFSANKPFRKSSEDLLESKYYTEPTLDMLGSMGMEKNQFATLLGRDVLRNLGIRVKRNSEIESDMKAFELAVGLQALQAMFDMGMIRITRLAKFQETPNGINKKDVIFIDHISFKWDSPDLAKVKPSTYRNRMAQKAVIRSLMSPETDYNQAEDIKGNLIGDGTKTTNAKTLHGLTNESFRLLRLKALLDTEPGKVVFPDKPNNITGVLETPFTATPEDVKNKTATGKNKTALDGVNAHNKTPFGLNSNEEGSGLADWFAALEANREALLHFLGAILEDEDNINTFNLSKASIENGYRRELDVFMQYFNGVNNHAADIAYLQHVMMSNQRIRPNTQLSPQAYKIIREVLLPISRDKDGKPIKYGFDISNLDNYLDLIDEAISLVQDKSYRAKVHKVDVTTDRYANVTGYVLALAQALGIKTENFREEVSFKKLKELLSNSDIANMIDDIATSLSEGKSVDPTNLKKAKDYGINTPRAFHALYTLAQIKTKKGINSIGLFESKLLIEADGKGNGVYNNNNQFAGGFTENYFQNNKRTGVVTTDLIAQALASGVPLEEIGGNGFLADKSNKDDILRDVYEAVADSLVVKIQNAIEHLKKNTEWDINTQSFNEVLFSDGYIVEQLRETEAEIDGEPNPYYEALSLLYTAKIIEHLDGLKGVDFNAPIAQINATEIARGIAKIAVTPSNYGGQVDGITSQLFTEIKDMFRHKSNDFYRKAKDADLEERKQLDKEYRDLLKLLGIDEEVEFEPSTLENTVNRLSKIPEKAKTYELLASTLGTTMFNAINDVYGEQFAIVRAIVNYDNALFYAFFTEFQDAIRNAINTRNIKKKWVNSEGTVLNPKAYNFLTEKELRDVLKNLKNVPNVATAMSNNTRLINELLHSGNSITKQAIIEYNSDINKSSVQAIFSINGQNEVWGVMKEVWDSYRPAGASLLVSSIVSIEALTQARLIEELAKEGIAISEVFDGAEINPIYRFKVGEMINRITDEIHKETSLIAAFFGQASRTNLDEIMGNLLNGPNIREMYKFNKNSENGEVLVSSQLLVGIQAVLSSINFMSVLRNSELSGLEQRAKKYESKHREFLLRLLQKLSTQAMSNEPVLVEVTEKERDAIVSLTKLMLTHHNTVPAALNYYRELAIDSKAMKEVENEYLAAVVNQFASISNGYVRMPKKAEDTLKRFIQYINDNPQYGDIVDLKLKSSSKILAEFVNQDSIIQEALKKAKAKFSKQYPLVIRQGKSVTLNIDNVKTVNELISVLEGRFKELDEINGRTGEHKLDQQVALGVMPMLKNLTDLYATLNGIDLPVTTNREEYAARLREHGAKQAAEIVANPQVNGYMHQKAGIFLEPYNLKINAYTGLHEVIHVGMDYLWGIFYLAPEKLKNSLNVKAGLSLIENVAKQFASTFINNSEYLKVTDFLHKQAKFSPNNAFSYTPDVVAAMAANINYVFSEEFASKASPKQVQEAKARAMREFLAYGLTNLNLMNHLHKFGLKNKKQVYEDTGFKQAWDSLKRMFHRLFNAFLSIFGYTQNKADRLDNSLLSHSVKALIVISNSKAEIKAIHKDITGSASINTTSFNNATHVSTEEAIRSLGSLDNNSEEHINNMLDIYNSVNQTLEEKNYRSYPEAYKDIKDNTFNTEAIKDINTLVQAGLSFTSLDENMFKLMYAVNKANFDNNPEYIKEATKILHNLLSNIPADSKASIFFEELSKLQPYSLLALVQTNEYLKSEVEQYLKEDSNKLQQFRNNAVYKGLNSEELQKPVIDKLSMLASKLKFDGKNSLVAQVKELGRKQKENESRIRALNAVNDFVEDISIKHIPTVAKFIATEWLSGHNLDNQDTNLEKALQNIAKRSALLANRPTLVSKFIRWYLGAMQDTQYIYSMQNSYPILPAVTKEKFGNLINASIDREFGKQLSEQEHTTLKRAFFDTGMHFIVNQGNIDINRVLTDNKYRKEEIRRITNALYKEYTGIDKNTLESFIEWQTDGLAEMNIKGLAKSNNDLITSFISPNARAIANLTLLKSIGEVPVNVSFNKEAVEYLANTLVSLKSLEYVENTQLNNLADMFSKYAKGMSLMSTEAIAAYRKEYEGYPNNYSGYQNYQHTRKNPNKDYEIVDAKDKETIDRLLQLGYENRMTLPAGELVFVTNQSVTNNLTNGILLFTESTVNGANQVTGKKLGDKSLTKDLHKPTVQKAFKELWETQIKGNKSYYSNLSNLSNYSITLNHDGSIRNVEAKLENKYKQMFIQEVVHSYEHIGDLQARQLEEIVVQRNNLNAISILNQAYKNDTDKSKYILFNGKYKPKGNSQEDIRFAKEFNDLYHMLPAQTRLELEYMGGLYLNRNELANIIGYEAASIVDIYTGKSGLPLKVQNAIKTVMAYLVKAKLVENPAKALKRAERLKAEVTSLAKDVVLNKSIIIPLANLVSNVIHLWMSGIPVTDIPKLIIQGYQEVKLYNTYEEEIYLLTHKAGTGQLSPQEKQKAVLKVQQLSKLKEKLSITPLMQSGMYTNISEKEINAESFTILEEIRKKYGLTNLESNTPAFVRNLAMVRGSKTHALMQESLNYGDFIAKYAIYMHLTTKKRIESNKALDFIRDEFVNYTMNRGREFDWLNKVGLTWFLAYKIGIQKVIYRNLRRNFLRTMAVWQAGDSLKEAGMDLGGIIQTVPQQRLWTDYSGYHFELDNMIDSFGSHWIERLLF